MKKRIYSILEVKERELNGKILFSIQMANNGYSVVIGKKNNLYEYSKYFRSGIFFFKGMGSKNIKPMEMIKELGHKIVGFDEEGLVMNMLETIPYRVNKKCLKLVDYFFTVGNYQRKNTIKHYPNEHKKVISAGNPRFDLMKKPIRKIYDKHVKMIKKKYGKFILFPSKFTIINNGDKKTLEYYLKIIHNSNSKNPYKRAYKSDWQDQIKIREKLINFFKYFPKKYPDITILVKMHPTEKKEFWINLIKEINCKNFKFANDKFPTNAYLLASEFSIGSNCHTSLESYLFNKPTINWRPTKKDGYLTSKIIRAVSKEIITSQSLENICKNWFIYKKQFKKKLGLTEKKILKDNIENLDYFSANILQKYFDKIKINNFHSSDKYSNQISFYLFKIFKKLKNIYYSFSSDKETIKFYKAKFEGLDIEEYTQLVIKFCKVMGLNYDNYIVKELYPGCFNIEKKAFNKDYKTN